MELGKIQELEILRETSIGVYLNEPEGGLDEDVLLPKSQVPEDAKIGDKLEVFLYRDSKDRIIATVRRPKILLGEMKMLRVIEAGNIGAFLDWGLEKDLLLPFKEQIGKVKSGDECLVSLYVDKSDRLCATMKIHNTLTDNSPYKEKDVVKGTVYAINRDMGVFVAVDDKYHGMIPLNEMYGIFDVGDQIEARVLKVRPDGKLNLSIRKEAHDEIEGDAELIMARLVKNKGFLPFNDKSQASAIKSEFGMSKSAFKRAVGRLLKFSKIEITDKGIKKL
ncbi:CvfB family protein [Alkalibacter mobilis]|uniref:CvfB family protein n=1 Tax=Alkalibacter mobilis TaxID=2787712 RepID=UPI00189F29B2|nr:S1-like domain-containing RNA-binding protein [Alkalibacter mobilis]MBF7096180.1 S1 RNA-binding domain-containing protein [Alkalibacter mobilis]